jgi:hypothetical protein
MNASKLTTLTAIAGLLAVGEFCSTVIIALGKAGSDTAGWPFAVVFGVLFLVAAWLLRSRRIITGAVLAGVLCLFEILNYPGWYKHGALDWTVDTTVVIVALAGLIGVIVVLADRFRRRAAA